MNTHIHTITKEQKNPISSANMQNTMITQKPDNDTTKTQKHRPFLSFKEKKCT